MRACEVPVAAVTAGAHARRRQLQGARKSRELRGVEHGANAAPRRKLVDVPQQPEARDVRHRARLEPANDVRGGQVELEHGFDRGVEGALGRDAVALRLEDDPGPETLRQEEHLVGPGACLRPDP